MRPKYLSVKPLDNRLYKRYNTSASQTAAYAKIREASLTTCTDHRHARTIRTQEYTRARNRGFYGQESTKKTKKHRKNVDFGVGGVEAASSSLVTQTKNRES